MNTIFVIKMTVGILWLVAVTWLIYSRFKKKPEPEVEQFEMEENIV